MLDQDAFIKALMGEDELGVVLRTHIHIEAWINELLGRMGLDMARLDKAQLEYHQRVHLAIALGLKHEHCAPLLAIGTIRNAFAHNLGAALTKERVNNLHNSLSPGDKAIVQRVYQKTNAQVESRAGDRPGSLRNLEPKDQFILMATAIHGMLRAAVVQLGGEP
jgi:hypothetical protein